MKTPTAAVALILSPGIWQIWLMFERNCFAISKPTVNIDLMCGNRRLSKRVGTSSGPKLCFPWFVAATLLTGCASEWRGPTTMVDSSGCDICALHHTPLKTEKVYVFNGCFQEIEAYARIR